MKEPSTGFLLRGTDEPPLERRALRAGPFTAVLENGTLRYVKLGEVEVVRGLYAAVRDRNWGTVEPRFTRYEVEEGRGSFRVLFTAEHENDEIGFVWDGEISGSGDGTIRFAMDGTARRAFLRNRIGFCVLHPMELAGTPVEVRSPDRTVQGRFPEEISAHQPFFDITGMRYQAGPGAEVELVFEGDLFETEDQRNWTDASYKTYCTPLRLPFPAEVGAGERVAQSVTLKALGEPEVGSTASREPEVVVGTEPVGTLPPLGFGVASHGDVLTGDELERLRTLKPAHLRVGLDLAGADWRESLLRAAIEADALDAMLEVEAVTDNEGRGLEALIEALAGERSRLARLLVFSGLTTTRPALERAKRLAEAAGIDAPIGGGSRAFFAELNRTELPLDLMDVVGYAISPQVHAFDDASLSETLAAQAATVESARGLVGGLPLAVGPITLKMPFNPVATGPEEEPEPGELPPEVDPRQMSLFCAGWTVGSVRRLAEASSLTYYETTGRRGLMEKAGGSPLPERFPSRSGTPFPVYHVFAELAGLAGTEVLPVETGDPLGVEALALRASGRLILLAANLTGERTSVAVRTPALVGAKVYVLDGATARESLSDGSGFRPRIDRTYQRPVERMDLELSPFSVALVEGVMG